MVAGAFAGWWLARQGLLAKPWLQQGAVADRGRSRGLDRRELRPARVSGRGRMSLRPAGQRLPDEHAGSPTGDRYRAPRSSGFNTGQLSGQPGADWTSCALRDRRPRRRAGAASGELPGDARLPRWTTACLAPTGGSRAISVADNPATSFLYLLTSMHALHVPGGLVGARADDASRAWRRARRAGLRRASDLLRDLLEFPAGRLAGLMAPADRVGRAISRSSAGSAD